MKNIKNLILPFFFVLSISAYAEPCLDNWQFTLSEHTISVNDIVYFDFDNLVEITGATGMIYYGDGYSQAFSLTGTGVSYNHQYTTEGVFNIIITISDGDCIDTKSYQVIVSDQSCFDLKFGNMSNNNYWCVNVSNNALVTEPTDPDYTLVNYYWNMGDGTIITNTNELLNYTYSLPGLYEVSIVGHFIDNYDNHCYSFASNALGTIIIFDIYVWDTSPIFSIDPSNPILEDNVEFNYEGNPLPEGPSAAFVSVFYINGSSVYSHSPNPISSTLPFYEILDIEAGIYSAKLSTHIIYNNMSICPQEYTLTFQVIDPEATCDTCNSFKPSVGTRYWMSAWVNVDEPSQVKSYNSTGQENGVNIDMTGYDETYIEIEFFGASTKVQFFPTGEIIDGWQRVVGEFTVPTGTLDFILNLYADENLDTYFDDIRIHPFNSSMKSYVYDGETFWLVAELDDNNYATFYEYDEEGGLVRIKKETARGIVTIQETRSNTTKTD